MSSEKFESRLAIRYLGGVLELPTFWVQQPDRNTQTVAKKLFDRVRQLVEDADVERPSVTNDNLQEIRADVEGTDILASALLNGSEDWHRKQFSSLLTECFERFVELLGQ